jgi:hypothetical protein
MVVHIKQSGQYETRSPDEAGWSNSWALYEVRGGVRWEILAWYSYETRVGWQKAETRQE